MALSENQRKFLANHPDIIARQSMKRRKSDHDYRSRCIYMVTMAVEGRHPLLGEVCHPDALHPIPYFKHSPLGLRVARYWNNIPLYHPAVKIIATQLMPDHMHGLLFVTEPMSKTLGEIIRGFKIACNRAAREMIDIERLWEDGFNDRIVLGPHALRRMVDYIHDNPRRLWLKREKRDLFTVIGDLEIGGRAVKAMGNRFLLESPELLSVRCSRSLDERGIEEAVERFLGAASRGAVPVSPAISAGEKAVMRIAFEAGYPMIIITEKELSRYSKPGGRLFDACSTGRMLVVSPAEWNGSRYTKITREGCELLNSIAADIAAGNISRRRR